MNTSFTAAQLRSLTEVQGQDNLSVRSGYMYRLPEALRDCKYFSDHKDSTHVLLTTRQHRQDFKCGGSYLRYKVLICLTRRLCWVRRLRVGRRVCLHRQCSNTFRSRQGRGTRSIGNDPSTPYVRSCMPAVYVMLH